MNKTFEILTWIINIEETFGNDFITAISLRR